MSQLAKLLVSVVFLIVAGAAYMIHLNGQLYPVAPLAFALIAVLLLIATKYTSMAWGIAAAVIFAAYIRGLVLLFPESILATDPSRNATRITALLRDGSLSAIPSTYYSRVPLFQLLVSKLKLVTGGDLQLAFAVFGVTFGILVTLTMAVLARQLDVPSRGVVAATLTGAVATTTMMYSWRTIPQTHAVGLWVTLLAASGIFYRSNGRIRPLLVILCLALTVTHKLGPLSITVLFGLILLIHVVRSCSLSLSQDRLAKTSIIFTILGVVLSAVQWSFLTSFDVLVVGKFGSLLSRFDFATSLGTADGTAAHRVSTGLWWFLARRGHSIVVILLGGVAWMSYAVNDLDRRHAHVLGAVVGVGILTATGVVGVDAINPIRAFFFVEAVLCVLIVGALYQRTGDATSGHVMIIVALLLVSQIAAVYTVPDTDGSRRQYLTTGEVAGAEFSPKINSQIASDMYYAERARRHVGADPDAWIRLDEALVNATLSNYPAVAVRTDVAVYRLFYQYRGWWRLEYRPSAQLEDSHHRVYQNGAIDFYVRSADRLNRTET